jgi:glutaryl-CoA dehydrogenase (non-decarboxylating)
MLSNSHDRLKIKSIFNNSIDFLITNYLAEAAKYMLYHAAWLKDKKLPSQQATSMAKLMSCQAAVHAANLTMKVYGSAGYSTEYPCGRWLRDAKQFETLEGTSNIHMGIVANIELGFQPNR